MRTNEWLKRGAWLAAVAIGSTPAVAQTTNTVQSKPDAGNQRAAQIAAASPMVVGVSIHYQAEHEAHVG